MNLTLDLNQEQLDAIQLRADAATPSLTSAALLEQLVTGQVNAWVQDDFNNAVRQLGDAARQMPYDDRKALIAQVAASIPRPE